nr:hypothetical protein [Mycobacterium sp. UM_NZ2]
MSWFKRIAGAVCFTDIDMIHKSSARGAAFPWPPDPADSSPRLGSPGEDGPTAPAPDPGAVGHLFEPQPGRLWTVPNPTNDVAAEIRALRESLENGFARVNGRLSEINRTLRRT